MAHDIGPVRKIGNLAKTFRFALGAKDAAGTVESFQGGIILGPKDNGRFEDKGLGYLVDGEPFIVTGIVVDRQRPLIEPQLFELQVYPVKYQRLFCTHPWLASQGQAADNPGGFFPEFKTQFDRIDPISRWRVVF